MTERVLKNIHLKINNLLDKCIRCEINVQEVQTEIINTMNVIVVEYNEIMNDESMNEIHIVLSKIIFSNNLETIIIELKKLRGLIKKTIIELIDISQNIDWYCEVKRRITQKDVFMSELMVSQNLEYEKRMKIFKEYVINEIRTKDGNDSEDVINIIRRLITKLWRVILNYIFIC